MFSMKIMRSFSELDINNPRHQSEIRQILQEGARLIQQIISSDRMLSFTEKSIRLHARYNEALQMLKPNSRPKTVVSFAFSEMLLDQMACDTRTLACEIIDEINSP